MSITLAAISAAIGLAGQVASGILSARNNKKMEQEAEQEAQRQEAYYKMKANENPLYKSENQAALAQLRKNLKDQQDTAKSVAKITGATPEYALAQQQIAADAYGDTISNISSRASAQKDMYEDKANQTGTWLYGVKSDISKQRNESYANLASNAAKAFSGLSASGSALSGLASTNPDKNPDNEEKNPDNEE